MILDCLDYKNLNEGHKMRVRFCKQADYAPPIDCQTYSGVMNVETGGDWVG